MMSSVTPTITTTSLSMPAKARIRSELSLLSTLPPPGISCYTPDDTLTYLHATLTGPVGSPFETGYFLLIIHISNDYPFEPPKINFLTPIHHPNIDSNGRICLDSLKNQLDGGSWSPDVTLPTLLQQIRTLIGRPNSKNGLDSQVTEQYVTNYQRWFWDATRMTMKEATIEKLNILEENYIRRCQTIASSSMVLMKEQTQNRSFCFHNDWSMKRTMMTMTISNKIASIDTEQMKIQKKDLENLYDRDTNNQYAMDTDISHGKRHMYREMSKLIGTKRKKCLNHENDDGDDENCIILPYSKIQKNLNTST